MKLNYFHRCMLFILGNVGLEGLTQAQPGSFNPFQQAKNTVFIVSKSFLGQKKAPNISDAKRRKILNKLSKELMAQKVEIIKLYKKPFVGALVSKKSLHKVQLNLDKYAIKKNRVVHTLGYESKIIENRQSLLSWGLDRIDQRDLPLDESYSVQDDGKNVHAYIVDSGLRSSHREFVGRVGIGESFWPDDDSTEDCDGHGTHVSGTVLGTQVGVAKKAIIHPIRVFECNGVSTTDIIVSAMNWIADNHEKPAVVNMSLGSEKDDLIDLSVQHTLDEGVMVVVAAGNDSMDACDFSPAGVLDAITVASSNRKDELSSFSNYGECIDIIAPGEEIYSSFIAEDDAYKFYSGTSMAAPHVAGAVAMIYSKSINLDVYGMSQNLFATASNDRITNSRKSSNKLLYAKEFELIPFVNAGKDLYIRLPKKEIFIDGYISNPKGMVTESYWEELKVEKYETSVSQNLIWNKLEIYDLPVGTFKYQLCMRNSEGQSAEDEVMVYVRETNFEPKANAGEDFSSKLNRYASLDAVKSWDPDGEIVKYQWKLVDGPEDGAILERESQSKASLFLKKSGDFTVELKVEDNEGGLGFDQIKVHSNFLPQAHAGDDQVLTKDKDATVLKGRASDPDSDFYRVQWQQLSGPNMVRFKDVEAAETEISQLQVGAYSFRFWVIDGLGQYSGDDVLVTVIDNYPPFVDAGNDREIELNEMLVVKGLCKDPDGRCKKIGWQLLRYPKKLQKIGDWSKSSQLSFSGVTPGEFEFLLQGVDDKGSVAEDTLIIRVLDNTDPF